MKLRIISDIHTDINNEKDYRFDFGDDFVINCGDTAGDRRFVASWVGFNMKRGVFVEGNHLGYEKITHDKRDTKQESIKYLRSAFKKKQSSF